MSTTPDLPPPDCWAILTPNGSKLVSPDEAKGRWNAYPLYTSDDVRAHADNCIRALQIDVGKTQEALRSALGEIAELKRHEWTEAQKIEFMAMLHSNVPEEDRPLGRSDYSDAQWSRVEAAFASLARAEKAEARAGSVPAGFVPVPAVPTDDMIVAGADAREARDGSIGAIFAAMLAVAPAAPSTPPDEATTRAQFEAWAMREAYDVSREPDGDYSLASARDCWEGWQAARTQGDAA